MTALTTKEMLSDLRSLYDNIGEAASLAYNREVPPEAPRWVKVRLQGVSSSITIAETYMRDVMSWVRGMEEADDE